MSFKKISKKKNLISENCFFFLPVSSVSSSRQKSKLLHIWHLSSMPLCPYYIANMIQTSCIKVYTKTSPHTACLHSHTCEKYSRVLKTQFNSSLQKQPLSNLRCSFCSYSLRLQLSVHHSVYQTISNPQCIYYSLLQDCELIEGRTLSSLYFQVPVLLSGLLLMLNKCYG